VATALNSALDPIWPITVEQYHAMVERGILTEDDPIELLDGVIVQKVPKNPAHIAATDYIRLILDRVLPPGWFVRSQDPIRLPTSEPEPDVCVIRGNRPDYNGRLPEARDLTLVVEVADATLDRDRIFKKRIYAEVGIPGYWILNLKARRLEAYSEPIDGSYKRSSFYGAGDSAPLELDGRIVCEIPVSDFLP
jgi:Uma2 family endonuclease